MEQDVGSCFVVVESCECHGAKGSTLRAVQHWRPAQRTPLQLANRLAVPLHQLSESEGLHSEMQCLPHDGKPHFLELASFGSLAIAF